MFIKVGDNISFQYNDQEEKCCLFFTRKNKVFPNKIVISTRRITTTIFRIEVREPKFEFSEYYDVPTLEYGRQFSSFVMENKNKQIPFFGNFVISKNSILISLLDKFMY
jgi:hypothetical protein